MVRMRKPALIVLVAISMTALLATVFSVATRPSGDTPVSTMEYPAVAPHRGGLALHPENTMEAFKATAEQYPDMALEMDVQRLADGALVVFHDATVKRVAAGGETKPVDQFTTAEWRKLRIKHPQGGPSAPAAFLSDVFDEFAGTGTVLMIECKGADMRDDFIEAVWPHRDQVIAVPKGYGSPDAPTFIKSGLNTQLPVKDETTPIIDGLNSVVVGASAVTKTMTDDAHSKGAKVWVWGDNLTINDPELLDKGVDGFIPDNPDQ